MKSISQFFLIALAAFHLQAAQPPGSSVAFVSTDPVVVQARKLFVEGEFSKATQFLQDSKSDAGDTQARTELIEVIRRTRLDYPMDIDDLLAKVKKDIPDVDLGDLRKWMEKGYVTARNIDGQIRIFNTEPENLYIFSKDARSRKEKREPKVAKKWVLIDHLKQVVNDAEATGKPEVDPVKHDVNFKITVPAGTKDMKAGSVLRVWIPLPQDYRQQKDVKLVSSEPQYKSISTNAMRTIYFEKTVSNPDEDQVFKVNYSYTSYAYYPDLKENMVQSLPENFPSEYLEERPPHILFTQEYKELAHDIVGREKNALAKVRKIFHWVSENIPWHSEEEYGTIPSICLKSMKMKTGDCGVQSLTFQTLCRIAGIPTRWQSGWETKPSHNSMHDWSEIYIAPWGWLPCDPSYGVQHSRDSKIKDFYCGHQDSYRMVFNLDYGQQFNPAKTTFRSEPLDSQRGEVELDGKNLYFDSWKYKMSFTTTPGK